MSISLNQLPSIKTKKAKRVGRGYGSGKGGHTATRGQKGQKSRSKLPLLFEGAKQRKSLIRRTPFLRGKLRNKAMDKKIIIFNLKDLSVFKDGQVVDIKSLVKHKILDAKLTSGYAIKILGDGEISRKLTVRLKTSKPAAKKIIKAGGKVELESKLKTGKKIETVKKQAKKTTKAKKTAVVNKKDKDKSKKWTALKALLML